MEVVSDLDAKGKRRSTKEVVAFALAQQAAKTGRLEDWQLVVVACNEWMAEIKAKNASTDSN